MILKISTPVGSASPSLLGAALETATRAAQAELALRKIPTLKSAIRQGVRWRPEPPGTGEELALPSTVLERGWGDCDDLAPWRAAELRTTGEDPGARAIAYRSGPQRWHAVVRRSDGSVEDPSRWAGMAGDSLSGISGQPTIPALAEPGRRAAAVVPDGSGRWHARVDLPSRRHPLHVCACAHADDPVAALIKAAQTAAYAAPGQGADVDAVAGVLCGDPAEDPEIVGFLDKLLSAAGQVVSAVPVAGPLVTQAARIASPVVSTAARVAQPVLSVAQAIPGVSHIATPIAQALPLSQSLLSALAQGGQVIQPAPAPAPALPAVPIQPGVPALSLPLPLDQGAGVVSWSATPGTPSPVVVRW